MLSYNFNILRRLNGEPIGMPKIKKLEVGNSELYLTNY